MSRTPKWSRASLAPGPPRRPRRATGDVAAVRRGEAVLELLRVATSARALAIRFDVTMPAMRALLRELEGRGLAKHAVLGGWVATGRAP